MQLYDIFIAVRNVVNREEIEKHRDKLSDFLCGKISVDGLGEGFKRMLIHDGVVDESGKRHPLIRAHFRKEYLKMTPVELTQACIDRATLDLGEFA